MRTIRTLLLLAIILIVACNKDISYTTTEEKKPETCNFLRGNYNFIARMSLKQQEIAFRKGGGTSPGRRDTDQDGVRDVNDNCPGTFNPDQADIDLDGVGDACDATNDDPDKDGVLSSVDNCPNTFNPTQTDTDLDGIGDACDVTQPPVEVIKRWVLLLDFDGHTVNTVYWNQGVPFYATPSGLSSVEIANVLAEVRKDYAQFPITVTTDTAIYLAADPFKRQRIVITQYNEWYCSCAGGVAFIGGIDFGGGQYNFGEVPGFVFSKMLSYNQKFIWEACSHEAGHTLGLYHQVQYGLDCSYINDYFDGGSSPNAPIMGNSYSKPGLWWIGPNSFGCNSIQNDSLIIRQKVGF